MDIITDFLPQKVKNINSTLYSNVWLWKSTVPFSMRTFHCKKCYRYQHQVGLKTLAVSQEEKILPYNVVHCYTVAPSSKTSSTPPLTPPPPPPPPPLPPSMWVSCSYAFRCTMIGDVLGAESGDYMTFEVKPEAEEEEEEEAKPSSLIRIKLSKGKEKMEEEKMKKKRGLQFPPPITLMRTHTGKMPWNFKRECGDYGRLVITAERVKRREYVEALRVNGKVTMKLVPEEEEEEEEEEESEYCEECGYSMNEEEEEETMELEDLEFNNEEEEEVEEEGGFEIEVEEEGYNSNLWDKERGLCWDFSECSVGVGDSNDFMGRPGSGPAHLRPITSVM